MIFRIVTFCAFALAVVYTQNELGEQVDNAALFDSNDVENMTNSGEERIVGGVPALRNEYPFMVSLQLITVLPSNDPLINQKPEIQKFCGGTIIDKRWILTAAHCFIYLDSTEYKHVYVNAGVNHALSYGGASQLINIEKIITPGFNITTKRNDICLVKLIKPLNFTDSVRSIELPPRDFDIMKKGYGVVIGWGTIVNTPNSRVQTNILMKLIQDIMTPENCYKSWNETEKETQFCLHDKRHPSGACIGDSGGPFIEFIDGIGYILGVTSFGDQNCGKHPTVQTRVTAYLDWIETTMATN